MAFAGFALTRGLSAIYNCHMSGRVKTTVYLDSDDYLRLKKVAGQLGRTPAALIREAVGEYARREGSPRRPKSLGMGRSGRGDLSEKAEDLLAPPKKIVEESPYSEYFDVRLEAGAIVLRPARLDQADRVREKLASLGISEADVQGAVAWARGKEKG